MISEIGLAKVRGSMSTLEVVGLSSVWSFCANLPPFRMRRLLLVDAEPSCLRLLIEGLNLFSLSAKVILEFPITSLS